MKQGKQFASLGQSNRAEQYFVAALAAGGDAEHIYPLLIDICIRAGRLGSAARHVEVRLRDRPDDPGLLRLSISLSESLGHRELANEKAEQLVNMDTRSADDDLFLGSFFERRERAEQARRHYASYLERTPPSKQEHGAVVALERLSKANVDTERQGGFDE